MDPVEVFHNAPVGFDRVRGARTCTRVRPASRRKLRTCAWTQPASRRKLPTCARIRPTSRRKLPTCARVRPGCGQPGGLTDEAGVVYDGSALISFLKNYGNLWKLWKYDKKGWIMTTVRRYRRIWGPPPYTKFLDIGSMCTGGGVRRVSV